MTSPEAADDYSALPGVHLTGDQVIAANMRYYREAAGLTQLEIAERLGWSKGNVSALERSASPENDVRRFNGEMVVALARALEVPLPAFYLPPPDDGITVRYLLDAIPGDCMHAGALAEMTLSTPRDDDAPASVAYQERYAEVVARYFDPGRGEQLATYLEDLGSAELRGLRLERLRYQRGALASLVDDVDQIIDAITSKGLEP